MTYALGAGSLRELVGVHPDLVRVVKRAIQLTTQDFTVHDGLRTEAEQRKLVHAGASQTMDSRHRTGHAVDLVPYINGKLRWEWEPIHVIAEAMRSAALDEHVPLVWGGAWDKIFSETLENPRQLIADYTARRRAKGRDVFLDGPHFELPRNVYP